MTREGPPPVTTRESKEYPAQPKLNVFKERKKKQTQNQEWPEGKTGEPPNARDVKKKKKQFPLKFNIQLLYHPTSAPLGIFPEQ